MSILLLSGCSLNPYNDEYSCNRGINTGACASVSENYEMSFLKTDNLPLTRRQKKILIQQVEDLDVINFNWFVKNEIEDKDFIQNLPNNKFFFFKAHYEKDLSKKSRKFLEKEVARRKKYLDENSNMFTSKASNFFEDVVTEEYIAKEEALQKQEMLKEEMQGQNQSKRRFK